MAMRLKVQRRKREPSWLRRPFGAAARAVSPTENNPFASAASTSGHGTTRAFPTMSSVSCHTYRRCGSVPCASPGSQLVCTGFVRSVSGYERTKLGYFLLAEGGTASTAS